MRSFSWGQTLRKPPSLVRSYVCVVGESLKADVLEGCLPAWGYLG